MGFLEQLRKNISVTANVDTAKTKSEKSLNPVLSDLRLYSNGSIYPSANLVKKLELEYQHKDDPKQGFGLDLFESTRFPNTAGSNVPFIMVGVTSKLKPKVDLFDSCRYDAQGNPLTSVLNQGSKSYGDTLWAMLKDVYGVDMPTEKGSYIDLDIVEDLTLQETLDTATNGVYNIPKVISRGEDKGKSTYVRRESMDVYILVPRRLMDDNAVVADNDGAAEVANTTNVKTEEVTN